MTAYCLDTSGSTSKEQALRAVAWMREKMTSEDVVLVFSHGAEVTTLEEIECAYAPNHVVTRGPAWFGGTCVKELMRLLKEIGQDTAYIVTDGCFTQEDVTVGKLVDIDKIPGQNVPPKRF